MNQPDFWHAGIDSRNVKTFVNFWFCMVKKALNQSNFEILKSAIYQEQLGQSA